MDLVRQLYGLLAQVDGLLLQAYGLAVQVYGPAVQVYGLAVQLPIALVQGSVASVPFHELPKQAYGSRVPAVDLLVLQSAFPIPSRKPVQLGNGRSMAYHKMRWNSLRRAVHPRFTARSNLSIKTVCKRSRKWFALPLLQCPRLTGLHRALLEQVLLAAVHDHLTEPRLPRSKQCPCGSNCLP